MIYPKFLSKGSCIGVPAPSSGAYDDLHVAKYANSKKRLEEMGYKCVLSENINKSSEFLQLILCIKFPLLNTFIVWILFKIVSSK